MVTQHDGSCPYNPEMSRALRAVGRNVLRKEGADKVVRSARYIDDLTFPNLLHARTIRSTIPSGEIVDVHFDFDIDGFTIVDHRDIPGQNIVALIEDDQPCLAERSVRHVAEPICCWRTKIASACARRTCESTYRENRPEFRSRGVRHVVQDHPHREGRPRPGVRRCRRHRRRGVSGRPSGTAVHRNQRRDCGSGPGRPRHDGVRLHAVPGTCVHRALTVLLDLPGDRVRVIQTETGGGFGGKEEYPSMIAGHAALLAIKARRPVKLVYDRVEDMLATTKRHPAVVRHRTGVTRDGRLTAVDIEAVFDAGAYATLSAVVLSRGLIHASGPYRCDHIRIRGKAMMTNTPPNGAFRGFGAPRRSSPLKCTWIGSRSSSGWIRCGLRDRNALRPGDTTATGQRLGDDCSARQVLREAVERTDFKRRRRALAGRIEVSACRCSFTAPDSPAGAKSSWRRRRRWR